jgi:hypothetical protein
MSYVIFSGAMKRHLTEDGAWSPWAACAKEFASKQAAIDYIALQGWALSQSDTRFDAAYVVELVS